MGFFSWHCQDTNRSIANTHSNRDTFSVTMTDNKGNKWTECCYEGFGMFNGKDYYELVAEMNGQKTREEGIGITFEGNPYLAPNLTEKEDWKWTSEIPQSCVYQGFFYPEEGEDDEEDY
jgi:hypothetical protein